MSSPGHNEDEFKALDLERVAFQVHLELASSPDAYSLSPDGPRTQYGRKSERSLLQFAALHVPAPALPSLLGNVRIELSGPSAPTPMLVS